MSNGGIIGPTITTTSGWLGSASGVFDISEVGRRRVAGTYPLPGIIYVTTALTSTMSRFRVSTDTTQFFSVARRNRSGTNCYTSSTAGYGSGGWDDAFTPGGSLPPYAPNFADKMPFATETFSSIGNLVSGRGFAGTVKTETAGYLAGGDQRTSGPVFTSIEKMPFATETFTALADSLTYAGRTSSMQSDTIGYFLRFGTGGVTDDQKKIVFATDTVSSIDIPRAFNQAGRWNRVGSSYVVGGQDAAGDQSFSVIEKFDHASETLSNTAMTLLGQSFGAGRGRAAGTVESVGDIGYFLAGFERLSGTSFTCVDGLRYDLITETRTNYRIQLINPENPGGVAQGPGFATPQ